jgi:hypothetical protein
MGSYSFTPKIITLDSEISEVRIDEWFISDRVSNNDKIEIEQDITYKYIIKTPPLINWTRIQVLLPLKEANADNPLANIYMDDTSFIVSNVSKTNVTVILTEETYLSTELLWNVTFPDYNHEEETVYLSLTNNISGKIIIQYVEFDYLSNKYEPIKIIKQYYRNGCKEELYYYDKNHSHFASQFEIPGQYISMKGCTLSDYNDSIEIILVSKRIPSK